MSNNKSDDTNSPITAEQMFRRMILDPGTTTIPGTNYPKAIILKRLGIQTINTQIDEKRLAQFFAVVDGMIKRDTDPDYWLPNDLDTTVMLCDEVIDFDGNLLVDNFEVTPFLDKSLRHGGKRQLFDKIAGIWLYPNQEKPLPDIITRAEAEFLQTVCYWLVKNPPRPRGFYWEIQRMAHSQAKGRVTFDTDRLRQIARFIYNHRDMTPNYDLLVDC